VFAELRARFDPFTGDAYGDALLAHPLTELDLVVGLVAVEFAELAATGFRGGT
jgi:hypothetical protein